MRRAAKPDTAKAAVVKALQQVGCHVVDLKMPVDLAVRRDCWPAGIFMLMEVKSAKLKSGKPRLDPRQTSQKRFIAAHGVPYVVEPEEAISALPLL